jgi:hypothetical protein
VKALYLKMRNSAIFQVVLSKTMTVYSGILSLHWTPRLSRGRGTGGGGAMGACAPPLFLKVKKVPFFWAKVPQLQNEKKYFLNKLPLLLERKCLFYSSKDSIKTISDVIETPYFQKFSFGS